MVMSARDFPYHVRSKKNDHWEATDWCEKNIGPRWEAVDNREGKWCVFWSGRSVPGYYDWYFVEEKDFLFFSLKWL
jgi:hypothetical protein